MIGGAHLVLYAHDPERARAFLRDVLGWAAVDAGDGWLIFGMPPAELACHPQEPGAEGRCELFLMCADIAATRRHLEALGASFTEPVADRGWGLVTRMEVPGYGGLGLYQPRHPSPLGQMPEH